MIELQNVTQSYGGSALLTDVSVQFAPGSFHFLTGPSGAGKSTLLKLLYGELRPTRGHVQLFGIASTNMARDQLARTRRRIGVVHQDCRFLDHLSLAENIALPLQIAGQLTPADRQNLADLLVWVGLAHRSDALPAELSGGERQRAALARAVMIDPEVILADEPTGNVDWEMAQRLLQLLIELNKMGKTIVLATHDLNLIRAAKTQVEARVLRIRDRQVQLAGASL
ncbi:cell division ATP-binding protein FtsE [Actibacterium pelagium]|uniref:Cell division protein FtsE n=1 Tax=Actibacterium pelagium TaxID=2029103 RepID=A0A917AGI0_9RHOB|nr:ATP-binding cassette domain-containing protein [Actibacterium pelagium]GGE51500.1 cell division protein FtsE [Actibacterium pelagium]